MVDFIADLDQTALPVDDFRKVMGIDPWHFWQMRTPAGCSGVYTHYRYTGENGPGRYDYIQAINMAEQQLAQKLNYWPGLKYEQAEEIRLVKPRQPVLYNRTPMQLETRWHHVMNVGLRTWTLLDEAVAVAYGASEDVVLSIVVPAGTVAGEVVVCYATTQTAIRPIKVTISAGNANITIKKWLMADPELWDTDDLIDPTDNDNFLSSVDIYRVTFNSQQAVLLAWEPEVQACGCLEETCVTCSNATHLACAVRGDWKHGLIGWQAAEYANARWTNHAFPSTRYPDLAYVNYQHGAYPYPSRYVSPYWQQVIAHFAVCFLDEADCGCGDTLSSIRHWMEDLALIKENSSRTLGQSATDNPFGSMRGQIAAWNAVLMHVGD